MRRARDERGVALMLAVWLIVVLGVLAAGVTAAARGGSEVAVTARARAAAASAAESGILLARRRIDSVLARHDRRPERAAALRDLGALLSDLREVEIPGGRFTVTGEDLGARIDLNFAGEATLAGLVGQFTDGGTAGRAVAGILDWRDADRIPRSDGAEAGTYLSSGEPWIPADGSLQRIEELPRIRGVGPSLAAELAPYVTVRGDGRINLNTAPRPVLAAVPAFGPRVASALVDRREDGEVFRSTSAVRAVVEERRRGPGSGGSAAARTTVVPSRILFLSRGWAKGHPLTHEIQAVYAVAGDHLELRSWEERDL